MTSFITSPSTTPTSTPTSLNFNLYNLENEKYQSLLQDLDQSKNNVNKASKCLSKIQQFIVKIPTDQRHSIIDIKSIITNQVNYLIKNNPIEHSISQLLMINIYNCIIKSTELEDSVDSNLIFDYIEDLKKSNYALLMPILKSKLSKTENADSIKIYSILLIFEYMTVLELQDVIFNDSNLFDEILTNLINNYDILLSKATTQQIIKQIFNYTFKYIRITKNELNIPLIKDLIKKSLQYPLSFQADVLTLIGKLYQMDKMSLILDKNDEAIFSFIHQSLQKNLDINKLEIICNLFLNTSFKNNSNELSLIISSGISNDLSKILADQLKLTSASKFNNENIQLKFILMNILSKLLFISKSAINLKNTIALVDILVENLQNCKDLKFQQISMFFLNNLVSKNICISNFSNYLYTNKLNIILEIFQKYLLNFENYSKPSSCSKNNSSKQKIQIINKISQIKSSIFQLYYLLIKNGSQFDKFQIMQYDVLKTFIKILAAPSQNNSPLLINLSLLSIYYMVDEYLWIINNDKCITKYDDDYNEKLPGVFQLMNLITNLQQVYQDINNDVNDNNNVNIKNNCIILLETFQRELDDNEDDTDDT